MDFNNQAKTLTISMDTGPVLIVGAGPCGLLAAIALQRHGVPILVLEREALSTHAADVGSGYDIAPTAQEVMCRLGIPLEGWCTKFQQSVVMDVCGNVLRRVSNESSAPMRACTRSAMQQQFLKALGDLSVVRFGTVVTGFRQHAEGVEVSLSDGSTVSGRALLGCDGIHSAVRDWMFQAYESPNLQPPLETHPDSFRFCEIDMWWGKCPISSDLHKRLNAVCRFSSNGTFMWCLGTSTHPGSFMGSTLCSGNVPDKASFLSWSFARPADLIPSGHTDDLARRGALTGQEAKRELEQHVRPLCPLIREAILATPPEAVAKVAVHQRLRLDLPYAHGRVALLGDAAHPQCPFLAQGVNMALVDAFLVAEHLAHEPVATALYRYASPPRQDAINAVIGRADWLGQTLMSTSWVTTFGLHSLARWGPSLKWLLDDPVRADESNRAALAQVVADFGLPAAPPNGDTANAA